MPNRPRLALASLLLLLTCAAWVSAPPVPERDDIVLGEGDWSFTWTRGWPALPADAHLGNTHGCVVVDRKDRIFLNTDAKNAVSVFATDGTPLFHWGEELAGGLHGMALVEDEGEERLLLAHTGLHQVLLATLAGEILWRVGYPAESGHYESEDAYRPTSVVPVPKEAGGGFFVADGYGRSWIHRYDAERRYVHSFGGPGSEPGKLNTPHGLWLDTRGEEPVLLVADRGNHRLQAFDLDGTPRGVLCELRLPCHMHPFGDVLAVADLQGRVTLLDADFKVLAHLGENEDPAKRGQNRVERADWRDGQFVSPHCANWDSKGNLYVADWVYQGRITKLARR